MSKFQRGFRAYFLILVTVLAVGILAMAVKNLVATNSNESLFVFYPVSKSTLPIVVTERGNLKSQIETTILCQVENVGSDRSGNYGTQIISIVPNGSAVEEGDLLVEFDSATIRDRLDTQSVAYQKATSAKTQAIAKYKNQLIQNDTAKAEAELAIKLAELELKMYVDDENGTFRLAVEEIERSIDEAKNTTLEARAALELAHVDLSGMSKLFDLGYRGKADLDQSQMKFLKSEVQLSSSLNNVQTFQGKRRKLTVYEKEMEILRLTGAKDTSVRALKQVINDNESLAEQALASRDEAIGTEAKELEILQRMERQLDVCKIFAPHDGMVVYYRERRGGNEIMEGATVRERQKILTLPDLNKMQVNTQVHEAVLDKVHMGLPATVRVDAFPNQTFPAIVEKVAVVPSSDRGWFGSSSVKTYETEVKIIDDVEGLKPGMTAVVNIHVDTIANVLTVPVQSVVQIDEETWCYVESASGIERRDITIGRSNDKFVEVREGLEEGIKIVLNPNDVIDDQRDQPSEISSESGSPELSEEVANKAAEARKDQINRADERQGQPGFGGPQGRGGKNFGGPGNPGGGKEQGRDRPSGMDGKSRGSGGFRGPQAGDGERRPGGKAQDGGRAPKTKREGPPRKRPAPSDSDT